MAMAEVVSPVTADMMASTLESPILSSPPIEDFPTFDHTFETMTDLHHVPITNKLVGQLASRDHISRTPSPRSTHFSVPPAGNGNGHRILRSATVGYVAPEFKGKKEQMLHGEHVRARVLPALLTSHSEGQDTCQFVDPRPPHR
jgi:hypothetical protein